MVSLIRHFTYDPDSEFNYLSNGALIASNFGPDVMFLILLPPLLFESASKIDWETFKRVAGQSILLAFPGVLISMGLTAVFVHYAFDYGWSW
jgi:NhaP-type Na+/H+ or K+/H+ antiporter